MPGPVLSENGENVLSSIRRLVSREPEKRPSADRAPVEAEPLLLTPAQRVEGPAEDETRPATSEADAPYVSFAPDRHGPGADPGRQASATRIRWIGRTATRRPRDASCRSAGRTDRSRPPRRRRGGRALDLVDDTARPMTRRCAISWPKSCARNSRVKWETGSRATCASSCGAKYTACSAVESWTDRALGSCLSRRDAACYP